MDKLKLFEKNDNIYDMYLSELKNMLYNNKKLSEESINIIKSIIEDKIKNSLIEKLKPNITDTESSISIELSESSELKESISDKQNIKDKQYHRYDKKEENQKFTQTSKKIFDRMLSQAEIINNSYINNNINKISRPYIDNQQKRLGERKYINKR